MASTTTSVHPSELKVGAHYVMESRVEHGVSKRTYYGAFVSSKLIGRPYDPDVILVFKNAGVLLTFTWDMQSEFFEVPVPLAG